MGRKVLAVISARKSQRHVEGVVTYLHDIFCLTLNEQISSAKYINPRRAYSAVSFNPGYINCGHDPVFAADASDIVSYDENLRVLKWRANDRFILDKKTLLLKERKPGVIIEGVAADLWDSFDFWSDMK